MLCFIVVVVVGTRCKRAGPKGELTLLSHTDVSVWHRATIVLRARLSRELPSM